MQFIKQSVIRTSPERLFTFHEQSDVLTMLLPPWESARVIQSARISEVGSQAIIETKVFGPISVRWVAEHRLYDPPRMFEDIQVKGPFRSWRHRHTVESHPDGALLRDQIDYEPPFGFLGRAVAPWLIEPRLRKLFDYRHQVTQRWCESLSSQEGV